jgi:hypothetical protein
VIVYWESRRPRPNTNQKVGLEKLSPAWPYPELFTVSVNT